jgi:DNA adenine methylase
MKNRSRTSTPAHEWYKTAHLYAIARRFIGVPIESDQATKVIKRYDTPETLFYVDPPYLPETRCMRWTGDAYSHEYTPQQHQDLAQLLHKVKGIVILSGYPSDLYAELYHDWLRTDKIITLRVRSNRGRGRKTTESIWLNPAAAESQRQLRLPFPGL